MPSRNVLKIDTPKSYYHAYARGTSRNPIFLNSDDYDYYISLLARYLSPEPAKDRNGVPYPHLYGKVELLSYCLMTNHFHFLLYQIEEGAMKTFMQCLMTSHSRYFNKKYKRSGSLFETRYKASMILDESYLQHISRYIHLNPKEWASFPYSSLHYYFAKGRPAWLQPQKIEELFVDREEYIQFVTDYEGHKEVLQQIKYDLANDS